MKTNTLPIIAYLAVIAAFVFLPVSAVAACIGLSAIGMTSILAADYGRAAEPVELTAPVVPCKASPVALTEYRVAA